MTGLGRMSVLLYIAAFIVYFDAPLSNLTWVIMDVFTGAATTYFWWTGVNRESRREPSTSSLPVRATVALFGVAECLIGLSHMMQPGATTLAQFSNADLQHVPLRGYGVIGFITGGLYHAVGVAWMDVPEMNTYVLLWHVWQAAGPILLNTPLHATWEILAFHACAAVSLLLFMGLDKKKQKPHRP